MDPFSFYDFIHEVEVLKLSLRKNGVDLPQKKEEINSYFKKSEIESITADSRRVNERSGFVAIKGHRHDGHKKIEEVVALKCKMLILQDEVSLPEAFEGYVLFVESTRQFFDKYCAWINGNPSSRMVCIGVTGTNGKTTTTNMVEKLLNDQQLPCAVMGTIDHHFGNQVYPSDLTTPGPDLLQSRLKEFLDAGAKACAMEVSSHALDQSRADSVNFDISIFTNLTRDHLDYHHSMENYFYAKQKLFDDLLWKSNKFDRVAIVNIDDEYGARLKVAPNAKKITYGFGKSDLQIKLRGLDFYKTDFSISHKNEKHLIQLPMIGIHNLYNATAAFACAMSLGLDKHLIIKSLETFAGVRGRLEKVEAKGIHVFVDYAHTDDALVNVLRTLKEIRDQSSPESKIITVFGCGGDRDSGKRPLMAKAAERYSDLVFVTSDNPRTEDPHRIISEIETGFTSDFRKSHVRTLADRKSAIHASLSEARVGDVILIAGKGHEDYQILGDQKIHFSDVETVAEWN